MLTTKQKKTTHDLRAARHQAAMLRSLKEVQADDNVVGFYQATALGAFFTQSLVETQAVHQRVLRHGGVVIVHGEYISPYGTSIERSKGVRF